MQDISGFGLRAVLRASNLFPAGFSITQFADDADPFDFPDVAIAEGAMGLNGDLIVWSTPNPIQVTISVIPGSPDDNNLNVLYEANRAGRGKSPSRDIITLAGIYAAGDTVTCARGRIINGRTGMSVASAGRLKTSTYTFIFEEAVHTRSFS